MKTLAPFSNAADWKQLHTDETSNCQNALVNVVMSFFIINNKLKTICLNGAIVAEDGTRESQCCAIIESFHDSAKLLQCWQSEMSSMVPNMPHLLEQVPNPNKINISWEIRCGMSHDTCNTACSLGDKCADKVISLAKEECPSCTDYFVYQNNCFHHLWNIWLDAVESCLAEKLEAHLKHDLDLIPSHLHDACCLSELLWQVDKEYSETSNYMKGHGRDFKDWRILYHPGK